MAYLSGKSPMAERVKGIFFYIESIVKFKIHYKTFFSFGCATCFELSCTDPYQGPKPDPDFENDLY